MNVGERQRLVLATIAARGILGHNSAVSMPGAFTARYLLEHLPIFPQDLGDDLKILTETGLLRKWNTGHADYGNTWTKGHDTWAITPEGLLVLWGCVPVEKEESS